MRDLNFHVDQRWPSASALAEPFLSRRKEAVATTGRFATVSDMQSSTSAEMITGIPPLLMMYAACTRDTIVVTTDKFVSLSEKPDRKGRGGSLEVEKMKRRRHRRRLSLMPRMRRMGSRMRARSARMSAGGLSE